MRDLQRVTNLHADSVATLEQVQNAGTALEVARQNQTIAQFNQQYSEVQIANQRKNRKTVAS